MEMSSGGNQADDLYRTGGPGALGWLHPDMKQVMMTDGDSPTVFRVPPAGACLVGIVSGDALDRLPWGLVAAAGCPLDTAVQLPFRAR